MVYALGGGLGHLTRALALARQATSIGVAIRVVTNSPFASQLIAASRDFIGDQTQFDVLPSTIEASECRERIVGWLQQHPHDLLFVDTFPRGLAGELADVIASQEQPKCLILRDLNPRYVARFQLERYAARYDRIFVAGEPTSLKGIPSLSITDPWLICDADELLPRREARRRLRVAPSDDRPVIVVVGTGRPGEVSEMSEVARRIKATWSTALVRFASVQSLAGHARADEVRDWPLFRLHLGIDLLVGAGGYHTVHEARASGTPLLGLARPRMYDRQNKRLREREFAPDLDGLMLRVGDWLATRRSRGLEPRTPVVFETGAKQAATESYQWLRSQAMGPRLA